MGDFFIKEDYLSSISKHKEKKEKHVILGM